MNDPFGSLHSTFYDVIYEDKDYLAESELIDDILRNFATLDTKKLLDLGCGTGNHAIHLAQIGYRVVGIDRSKSMLNVAVDKLNQYQLESQVEFRQAEIESFKYNDKFDAALLMFAVLGYQITNKDVKSTLQNVRKHLRTGGLLIFDVWYGPAVLNQKPADRIKVINTENGKLIRSASGSLDTLNHICQVDYHFWNIEQNELINEEEESHKLRYFFPLELELFLDLSGFRLRNLRAFPDTEKRPSENTWKIVGIASAK